MEKIYEQNYSDLKWREIKEMIYPKDISPYKWIIWYDIKDSEGKKHPENKKKIPLSKTRLSQALRR